MSNDIRKFLNLIEDEKAPAPQLAPSPEGTRSAGKVNLWKSLNETSRKDPPKTVLKEDDERRLLRLFDQEMSLLESEELTERPLDWAADKIKGGVQRVGAAMGNRYAKGAVRTRNLGGDIQGDFKEWCGEHGKEVFDLNSVHEFLETVHNFTPEQIKQIDGLADADFGLNTGPMGGPGQQQAAGAGGTPSPANQNAPGSAGSTSAPANQNAQGASAPASGAAAPSGEFDPDKTISMNPDEFKSATDAAGAPEINAPANANPSASAPSAPAAPASNQIDPAEVKTGDSFLAKSGKVVKVGPQNPDGSFKLFVGKNNIGNKTADQIAKSFTKAQESPAAPPESPAAPAEPEAPAAAPAAPANANPEPAPAAAATDITQRYASSNVMASADNLKPGVTLLWPSGSYATVKSVNGDKIALEFFHVDPATKKTDQNSNVRELDTATLKQNFGKQKVKVESPAASPATESFTPKMRDLLKLFETVELDEFSGGLSADPNVSLDPAVRARAGTGGGGGGGGGGGDVSSLSAVPRSLASGPAPTPDPNAGKGSWAKLDREKLNKYFRHVTTFASKNNIPLPSTSQAGAASGAPNASQQASDARSSAGGAGGGAGSGGVSDPEAQQPSGKAGGGMGGAGGGGGSKAQQPSGKNEISKRDKMEMFDDIMEDIQDEYKRMWSGTPANFKLLGKKTPASLKKFSFAGAPGMAAAPKPKSATVGTSKPEANATAPAAAVATAPASQETVNAEYQFRDLLDKILNEKGNIKAGPSLNQEEVLELAKIGWSFLNYRVR